MIIRGKDGQPAGVLVPSSFGRAIVSFLKGSGFTVKCVDSQSPEGPFFASKYGATVLMSVDPTPNPPDHDIVSVQLPPGLLALLRKSRNAQLMSDTISLVETSGGASLSGE